MYTKTEECLWEPEALTSLNWILEVRLPGLLSKVTLKEFLTCQRFGVFARIQASLYLPQLELTRLLESGKRRRCFVALSSFHMILQLSIGPRTVNTSSLETEMEWQLYSRQTPLRLLEPMLQRKPGTSMDGLRTSSGHQTAKFLHMELMVESQTSKLDKSRMARSARSFPRVLVYPVLYLILTGLKMVPQLLLTPKPTSYSSSTCKAAVLPMPRP